MERFIQLILLCSFISSLLAFNCSTVTDTTLCSQMTGCTSGSSGCTGTFAPTCNTTVCYYIDPVNGSDTNTGAALYPFLTLTYAFKKVAAVTTTATLTVLNYNSDTEVIVYNYTNFTTAATVYVFRQFSNYTYTINMQSFDVSTIPTNNSMAIYIAAGQLQIVGAMFNANSVPTGVTPLFELGNGKLTLRDTLIQDYLGSAVFVHCASTYTSAQFNYTGGRYANSTFTFRLLGGTSTVAHVWRNVRFISNVVSDYLIYATPGIEITNVFVRYGSSLFINSTTTTITVTNLTIKDYTGNFLDITYINKISLNTSLFQNIASPSSVPFIRFTNVGASYGTAHAFKALVFQNMSVKHSVLLLDRGLQKINFENVTYDTIYKMSDAVGTTVLDLEYDATWPGGVCFLGRNSVSYNVTTSTFQNIYSHCGALTGSTLLMVSSVFNNTALNYTPVAVSEDDIDETYGVTFLYFSGGTTDAAPGNGIAIKTSKFISNMITPLYGGALRFTSAFTITLTITDTQFLNCGAFYGGAIYTDNSLLVLQMHGGTFYQNQAKTNGGAILKKSDGISVMSSSVSTLFLNTTTFTENTATGKGGAVYLDYEILKMNTTTFTSNTAANGGGMYYIRQSNLATSSTDKYMQNSTFTSNYASNSGNAMKILFKYALLSERSTSPTVFVNNSETDTSKNYSDGRPSYYMFSFYDVLTSQKVTSASDYKTWINDTTLTRLTNQVNSSAIPAGFQLNHKSGNPLTQLIMVQVYDDYDKAVTYINQETVSLEITDTQNTVSDFQAFIAGNIATFTFEQGQFFMKSTVKMVGQPTTTATLTYTGSTDTSIILNDAQSLMDMLWTVYFINCELGDIFSTLTKQCDTCPEGSYSLEDPYSNSVCIDCSSHATCPGGAQIAPSAGYWRFSAMSDNILECPETGACIGGLVNDEYYPQGLCTAPYSGNMCNTCDSNFAKFGNSATCVDCSTDTIYYIKFTGYFVIQLVALLYGVKCNIDKMSNTKKANLEGNQALKEKIHNEDFQSNLMKIGVNFLQVSAIVIDYKFDWPAFITNFINVTNKFFPSQKEGFSIDCLITLATGQNEYTYFIKLVITLIEPFALWVSLILMYALYLKIKGEKVKGNPNFKKDMLVLFIITAFLLQPTIMQATLQMFKCENLNVSSDPQYYMSDNSATECWTPFHLLWSLAIALPNFLLWTFILPGVLLRMLIKKAKDLKNMEVYARYSFVYEGLKTDKFYWEFVVMLRKMLIVLIFVFFNFISVQSQAFATFLVVLVFGCLHYVFWPYSDERLNRAEMVALISLGVMVYCGMFFLSNGGSAWLYIVLIVVSLLFNLFFFVYLGILFLKSYKKTAVIMRKKLSEVIERRRTQRSGSKSNNSSMSSEKKNTIVDIQDLSLVLGKVQIENGNLDSPTTQIPQMSEGHRFVHREKHGDDDDSGIPSELNVNRWTSGKTVFNDEKADVDNYSVLRSSVRGKSEVRTEARTNAKRLSGGSAMTPDLFQDVIHLYNMRRSSLANSNDQKYLGKSFSIFEKAEGEIEKENENGQEKQDEIDDEEKQRRYDEEKERREQNPEKYDEKSPKDHAKKHSKKDLDEENKRGKSNNMDDNDQE